MASFTPPSTATSPRLGPTTSSSSTSRAAPPPTISLPLHPGSSLGPFVLGSTVYTTLRYLRYSSPLYHSQSNGGQAHSYGGSSQSHNTTKAQGPTLFPRVTIDFEAQDPRDGLLIVRPDRRISCVFENGRIRIVLLDLGGALDDVDSKVSQEEDQVAYERRVELLWKNKVLHSDGVSARGPSKGSASLNRGDIHQLFGPTYPARKYSSTDGMHDYLPLAANKSPNSSSLERVPAQKQRWILSYDGFSFLFKAEGQDRVELGKNARPIALVLHVGEDPLNPGEALWPRICRSISPSVGAIRGNGTRAITLEPQAIDTAQTDGLWKDASIAGGGVIIDEAIIKPHHGLTLHLIRPPEGEPTQSSRTTIRSSVQLALHQTTQQDVLLDLGSPERKWVKGDRDALNGIVPDTDIDEVDFDTSGPPATFYSYPSLGLDLLFGPLGESYDEAEEDASLPLLRKIVVHSDVPGSATWGRFEFVNWKIEVSTMNTKRNVSISEDVASSATTKSKSETTSMSSYKSSKKKNNTTGKTPAAAAVVVDLVNSRSSVGTATPSPPPPPPSLPVQEDDEPVSSSSSGGGGGGKVEYLDWQSDISELSSALSPTISSTPSNPNTTSTSTSTSTATPPISISISTSNTTSTSTTSPSTGFTKSTNRSREVLDLDRSTSSEFRGLLTLDVRTTLRGFPGLIAEILPLPIGGGGIGRAEGAGAGAGAGGGVSENKGGEERGIVIGWTIV